MVTSTFMRFISRMSPCLIINTNRSYYVIPIIKYVPYVIYQKLKLRYFIGLYTYILFIYLLVKLLIYLFICILLILRQNK